MNCRIDVQKYLNRKVKDYVGDISEFDESGYTMVNKNFNQDNLKKVSKLNESYGYKFLDYTKSKDNDLPNSLQMDVKDHVVQFYINKYGDKQNEDKKPLPKRIKDYKTGKKDILENPELKKSKKNNNLEDIEKFILTNQEKGLKLSTILENVISNFGEISEGNNEVLRKVQLLLKSVDTNIKFVDSSQLIGEDVIMQYNTSNNSIEISKEKLNNRSLEDVLSDVIHEATHAATHYLLDQDIPISNSIAREARTNLIKLYEKYKAENPNSESYGFENKHEFVAEAFSNPQFQDELKVKGFWNKFIEFIRKMFGFQSDFDKVISNITDLVKEEPLTETLYKDTIFAKVNKDYNSDIYQEKIDKLYAKIKTNVDIQLKFISKYKKANKKTKKYDDKTKKLQKELNKFEDVNKLKGIITYINNIDSQIKGLSVSIGKKKIKSSELPYILNKYQNYQALYSTVEDIKKLYFDLEENGNINHDPNRGIYKKLERISNSYNYITRQKLNVSRRIFVEHLSDLKYNRPTVAKWEEKFEHEYNHDKKILKHSYTKKDYIKKQLDANIDKIKEDAKEFIFDMVHSDKFDISYFDKMFLSGLESNSDIVQLFEFIMTDIRDKIIQEVLPLDKRMSEVDENLKKSKNTNSPEKIFGKLVEWAKDGKLYLKGEYKISFLDKKRELDVLNERKSELKLELKNTESEELEKELKEVSKKVKVINEDLYEYFIEEDEIILNVKDKWKNDLSNLSRAEREALDYYRELSGIISDNTFGINSLIVRPSQNVEFHQVPRVLKSDAERLYNKDFKGILKDKKDFLTKDRNDDFDYAKADASGKVIDEIPIHFRGFIDKNDQTFDLSTAYKMDFQNTIQFKIKNKYKHLTDSFIDVIKNTKTNRKKGLLNKYVYNQYDSNKEDKDKYPLTDDEIDKNSNIVQKLRSIYETRFMDITKGSPVEFGGVDINKIISALNGWTGALGMSLNYHSALANVTQGFSQVLMDAVSSDIITLKSLKKAGSVYLKNTNGMLKDLNNNYDKSFVNQILNQFDVFGGFNIGTNNYTQDKAFKKFTNLHSLQFMHSLGEHQMQSILTMAMLDSIKVYDKNNKLTDKSILDSLKIDKKGDLVLDNDVKYTDYTKLIEWNKGGRSIVTQMIKFKIFKVFGNYDSNLQPEIMRTPAGRLLMMYRRFFFPMLMNRYRGIQNAGKRIEDIETNDRFFSWANGRFEEGHYITTFRFLKYGVLGSLKNLRFEIAKSEWNSLTDYEKSNIRKMLVEASIVSLSFIAHTLISAAADEDDNDALYFFAYLAARNQSETLQFLNPADFSRILRSPFASLRTVDNYINFIGTLLTPWNWLDTYETGPKKDQLKALNALEKNIPIINTKLFRQLVKDEKVNEQMYNFLKSSWIGM